MRWTHDGTRDRFATASRCRPLRDGQPLQAPNTGRFCSHYYSPPAVWTDSFTVSWDGKNNWVLPPPHRLTDAVVHMADRCGGPSRRLGDDGASGACGTIIAETPRWTKGAAPSGRARGPYLRDWQQVAAASGFTALPAKPDDFLHFLRVATQEEADTASAQTKMRICAIDAASQGPPRRRRHRLGRRGVPARRPPGGPARQTRTAAGPSPRGRGRFSSPQPPGPGNTIGTCPNGAPSPTGTRS